MSSIESIWEYSKLIEGLPHPYAERPSLQAVLEGTPETFKHIAQYAAAWGIGDDGYRSELIQQARPEFIANLTWVHDVHGGALLDWLAGPESYANPLSEAYVAFTSMTMAADGF